MGIPVIDFIIVSENNHHSFNERLKRVGTSFDYVADGMQATLFDLMEIERPVYEMSVRKIDRHYFQPIQQKAGYFQLQNRRYLGNKHKLLGFIEDIISEKCGEINSFCDIFAGTGVVGERFNTSEVKVISNDFLLANYTCLRAFLGVSGNIQDDTEKKIGYLNTLQGEDNTIFLDILGEHIFIRKCKKLAR